MEHVVAYQSLASIHLVFKRRSKLIEKKRIKKNSLLKILNFPQNTYLQSGAKAPLWSVFNWCSKRVLLLILGFGAAAAAADAGRFTPLAVAAGLPTTSVDGDGDASTELLLHLRVVLCTVIFGVDEASSIVVSISVPIDDCIVDCVPVMLLVVLLLQMFDVD